MSSNSPSTTTDVHVLVAPAALWQAELRCAYSSVCSQSMSAGFARVSPGLTLLDLRSALSQQLDPEVLPQKYVFLRNVGRHMALVSAWQEERFKVAIFAPPFTASSEVYLIDAHCVDIRAAQSSLSSPSSSSLLPRPLPARPRAYSLSPLAPRQPPAHSPPTQLLYSTLGKPSAGGARQRAATLDSSELMRHVSAALNHIAEESPVGAGMLEGGAQPSDTACATIACSSQESSTVGWHGGLVADPADHRRRVIENMSHNIQTVVCDSLVRDVTPQGLQSGSVDTSLTSSWVDSEPGGGSSNVSQVNTANWSGVKRSLPTSPTAAVLTTVPNHHTTPGAEPVRCDVRPDGEGASCEEELAQSEDEEDEEGEEDEKGEEDEEGEVHNVIGSPLESHKGCLSLHSPYISHNHVVDCEQGYQDRSAGMADKGGKRVAAHLEEGGGGVGSLEEGDRGVADLEEGDGGVADLEEGDGGVADLEEGDGGVADLEEGGGGVIMLHHKEGRGGVTPKEKIGGGVKWQEDSSTNPQLVLRDSEGSPVPPSMQCGCEPSFPLSPPLPPIGAQWQKTQAEPSAPADPAGVSHCTKSGEQTTPTQGSRTTPTQVECSKEHKWKGLFLSEQKRAASLLAHEKRLEQEQFQLAQGQSAKAPAGRSLSNPPSQLTNVRLQLTKMEKELEDLKQRVQLTKIDLAREQQDRRQVGSDSKALRKELLGKKLSKSNARGQ